MNYLEAAQDLQIYLPDAPLPVLMRGVQRAAHRFFRETEAYQVDATGTAASFITPAIPADTEIATVRYIEYGGMTLVPTSPRELDYLVDDWRTATGEPEAYILTPNNSIQLIPGPTSGTYKATLAVTPTIHARAMADTSLFLRYFDDITIGALAFVNNMPVFGNQGEGVKLEQQFDLHIAKARSRVNNDHQPKFRVVRYGGI